MSDMYIQQRQLLSSNLTSLETDLAAAKAKIPNLRNVDEISGTNKVVEILAGQISKISKQLKELDAAHPLLTPPLSGYEGEEKLGDESNLFLKPTSIVAYICLMQDCLHAGAEYAFIEGQNVTKGMGQQEELGKMEADLQRTQGNLELTKGITQAALEATSGAVQMKGVRDRGKAMSKGVQSSEGRTAVKQTEDDAKQKLDTNAASRAKLQRQNETDQRILDRQPGGGGAAIGSQPQHAFGPQASPQKTAEIKARMAERNAEIKKLDQKDVEIKHGVDHQKQEILRQEMVTQEQRARGYDHFLSAGQKVVEGYFNQQIKFVEAEITMTRTHIDILKTYIGSATKGEAEGHDQAKASADAMNQAFSQRTQSFWRGAS